MNYIDLLLVAIVLISAWSGYRQGFIYSATGLLSWVASLVIAFLVYKPVASLLHLAMPSAGFWLPPFSFLISITLGKLIVDAVATLLLRQLPAKAHSNPLNKAFGVIPGTITGLIWAVMLAAVLLLVPFTNRVSKETHDSLLATKLAGQVSWLDDSLSPVLSEALNRAVSKSTAALNSESSTKLPFKVKDATIREDLEKEMLTMVNDERKERGLKPLKADPELAIVARKHSADMFARSYFSHHTPEGDDPFDRMRKEHVFFLIAGENLALSQTLIVAHNSLMHSVGHRANILNPGFGRLGIGILDGGIYGLMITQNFRN